MSGPVDASPMDILVVDDDTLVSTAVREKVEADGHRVTVASGGLAGFRTPPDKRAEGDVSRVCAHKFE
jgi:CheY-like chemotaxis protein